MQCFYRDIVRWENIYTEFSWDIWVDQTEWSLNVDLRLFQHSVRKGKIDKKREGEKSVEIQGLFVSLKKFLLKQQVIYKLKIYFIR